MAYTLLAVEISPEWVAAIGIAGAGAVGVLGGAAIKFYSNWRTARTQANVADSSADIERATKTSDLLSRSEDRHTEQLKAQREEFGQFLDRLDIQIADLRKELQEKELTIADLRRQLADKGKQ